VTLGKDRDQPLNKMKLYLALALLLFGTQLKADEPVYPFPADQIKSAYSDGLYWECTSKDGVTKSGSICPVSSKNGVGTSITQHDDGSPDTVTLHWKHGVSTIDN